MSSFLRVPFFFLSHLDELDKWRLNTDPAEIYLNLRSFKVLDDDYLLCATVCCVPSSQKHLTGLLGGKKPQKLQKNASVSSSEATAEYSKSRERKCVPAECMRVCCMSSKKKKEREREKKSGQLSQLDCKSIVWHKYGKDSHSPLVHPANKEQGFLISVSDTRSGLQPTGRAQQRQRRVSPRLQNKHQVSSEGKKYILLSVIFIFIVMQKWNPTWKTLNSHKKKIKLTQQGWKVLFFFFKYGKGNNLSA